MAGGYRRGATSARQKRVWGLEFLAKRRESALVGQDGEPTTEATIHPAPTRSSFQRGDATGAPGQEQPGHR